MGGVQYATSTRPACGFRALKKTPEAPYTTKVNNRVCTSRGTTLNGSAEHYALGRNTRAGAGAARPQRRNTKAPQPLRNTRVHLSKATPPHTRIVFFGAAWGSKTACLRDSFGLYL
jgi:hypothetical protein